MNKIARPEQRRKSPKVDSFVRYLLPSPTTKHDISVTSAVQALFAIDDTPDSDPCVKNPSEYPLDQHILGLLQSATLQKWLVMDTYYFTTGRFMGALDWHAKYIPKETLAVGMMNCVDLEEDDLVARFHTIDISGVLDQHLGCPLRMNSCPTSRDGRRSVQGVESSRFWGATK